MFERFTDRARHALAWAHQEAQRLNHDYIGTEHVVLGIVKEGTGPTAVFLKRCDVSLDALRLEVEKLVPPRSGPVAMGRPRQSPPVMRATDHAVQEARAFKHTYVGTEHLMLALLRDHESVGTKALANLGFQMDQLRQEMLDLLASRKHDGAEDSV